MKLKDMKAVKWKEMVEEGIEAVLTSVFILGIMIVVILIPSTLVMLPLALAKYLLT